VTLQNSKLLIATAAALVAAAGCNNAPPPPRSAPPPRNVAGIERDPVKPIVITEDAQVAQLPPGFNDVPLVNQRTPEEQAFVRAYNAVGRPRIVVFVNRTLEGNVIPVTEHDPALSVQYSRRATTGVSVEKQTNSNWGGYYGGGQQTQTDSFKSTGPGEYRESTEVYLPRGKYDEVAAKELDYQAVENILTDWLSASGQATIVSPMLARQRLSDEQVRELEAGRPQVLREVAQQLDADVLVHVTMRPTRQVAPGLDGLQVRLIGEAMNTRDGQSIGRAVVDVPPPLDKQQINLYTRFVGRKLMDGMTSTWAAGSGNPTPPATNAPLPPPAAPATPLPAQSTRPSGPAIEEVSPAAPPPPPANRPLQP